MLYLHYRQEQDSVLYGGQAMKDSQQSLNPRLHLKSYPLFGALLVEKQEPWAFSASWVQSLSCHLRDYYLVKLQMRYLMGDLTGRKSQFALLLWQASCLCCHFEGWKRKYQIQRQLPSCEEVGQIIDFLDLEQMDFPGSIDLWSNCQLL